MQDTDRASAPRKQAPVPMQDTVQRAAALNAHPGRREALQAFISSDAKPQLDSRALDPAVLAVATWRSSLPPALINTIVSPRSASQLIAGGSVATALPDTQQALGGSTTGAEAGRDPRASSGAEGSVPEAASRGLREAERSGAADLSGGAEASQPGQRSTELPQPSSARIGGRWTACACRMCLGSTLEAAEAVRDHAGPGAPCGRLVCLGTSVPYPCLLLQLQPSGRRTRCMQSILGCRVLPLVSGSLTCTPKLAGKVRRGAMQGQTKLPCTRR